MNNLKPIATNLLLSLRRPIQTDVLQVAQMADNTGSIFRRNLSLESASLFDRITLDYVCTPEGAFFAGLYDGTLYYSKITQYKPAPAYLLN